MGGCTSLVLSNRLQVETNLVSGTGVIIGAVAMLADAQICTLPCQYGGALALP